MRELWKLWILRSLAFVVQQAILDYANTIENVEKKAQFITTMAELKIWLTMSNNPVKMAIANLIPFGRTF